MSIPIQKWVFAPCPECGAEVTSAEHNRDFEVGPNSRHQGWTVLPCGHRPATYSPPTCAHPEDARQPSVMYREGEATYCKQCQSLVFADGHTESVTITAVKTTRR